MEIKRKFYSQRKDQKERNNSTYILTIKGEPLNNNFFEQYIKYASNLGYTLKENGKYTAIEFEGRYIVRIYKRNDKNTSFSIRFFPKDFNLKNNIENKKITYNIKNIEDLRKAKIMLSEKINAKKA